MPIIEMAALSPAAQLCLKTASTASGLVSSPLGFTGRNAELPWPTFAALPVLELMRHGLLGCSTHDALALDLTDRGIALVDHGRYVYEDRP